MGKAVQRERTEALLELKGRDLGEEQVAKVGDIEGAHDPSAEGGRWRRLVVHRRFAEVGRIGFEL
jgi:hypothetical protein